MPLRSATAVKFGAHVPVTAAVTDPGIQADLFPNRRAVALRIAPRAGA